MATDGRLRTTSGLASVRARLRTVSVRLATSAAIWLATASLAQAAPELFPSSAGDWIDALIAKWPDDPPLPDGYPPLKFIYWWASGVAFWPEPHLDRMLPSLAKLSAVEARLWRAPSWCRRWDDGCTVCERDSETAATTCRQSTLPPQKWCYRLHHTLCTGVDLTAMRSACARPQVFRLTRDDVLQGANHLFTTHMQDFPLDENNNRSPKPSSRDIKGLDLQHLKSDADLKYLRLAFEGAASEYVFWRLEAGRFFTCGRADKARQHHGAH